MMGYSAKDYFTLRDSLGINLLRYGIHHRIEGLFNKTKDFPHYVFLTTQNIFVEFPNQVHCKWL